MAKQLDDGGIVLTSTMESLQRFLMSNGLYLEAAGGSRVGVIHLFNVYERRTHKLFLDDGPFTIDELIATLDVPIMLIGQVPT